MRLLRWPRGSPLQLFPTPSSQTPSPCPLPSPRPCKTEPSVSVPICYLRHYGPHLCQARHRHRSPRGARPGDTCQSAAHGLVFQPEVCLHPSRPLPCVLCSFEEGAHLFRPESGIHFVLVTIAAVGPLSTLGKTPPLKLLPTVQLGHTPPCHCHL